jgi:hypothetical protein
MPRGGARPGSGPKKGTKYRKRFALTAPAVEGGNKPTASQRMATLRHQVALWTSCDMTPDDIAAVLGYDVTKLKTVFARELAFGHSIIKANLLARLDDAGNVAADKRLLDEIGPNAPFPAEAKIGTDFGSEKPDRDSATGNRSRGIGKKKRAIWEAQNCDLRGTPFDGLLGDDKSKIQ